MSEQNRQCLRLKCTMGKADYLRVDQHKTGKVFFGVIVDDKWQTDIVLNPEDVKRLIEYLRTLDL